MHPLRGISPTVALGVAATVFLPTSPIAFGADELPASPFEAFALQPGASVTWSQVIGQMDSRGASATITALVVKNDGAAIQVMRGVRINLAHANPGVSCDWKYPAWNVMCRKANAAFYIEEARLREVQAMLLRGAAELRSFEFISEYGLPRARPSGLIVCGYEFEGMTGADLARLLAIAQDAIGAAGR